MKANSYNKNFFDEKINDNNILNDSLININNLIQKILDEQKNNRNNENNKTEIENLGERPNDINNNTMNNSQNINNQYGPNFHIKNTTNIKGLYLNSINSSTNTYDFNDYRDRNNIITDYDKVKNKSNELINLQKNQNEKLKIKKDNKIYKNELNFNSKKLKVDRSRKNSKKKRENLSIKDYIKKAKILFDEEKQNKLKNNSRSFNQLDVKSEDNNNLNKDIKADINSKLNKFMNIKKRAYTEKSIKEINSFSTGNRKKTKNIIISNNNFINSNIKRKSFHKSKKMTSKSKLSKPNINNNNINTDINMNTNNNTNKNIELRGKEKSYYILSNSPILRLKERILFGRSTPNLRSFQKIEVILNKNEIYLNNKIKDLNEKINECDKKINISFNPSKTAEINFNFILSKDEDELKHFELFSDNESDKKEYAIYMKLIYILFDENYENVEMKKLNDNLFICINKKGYKNIKDYLYYLYFKNKESIDIIHKINQINNVLGDVNFYSNKSFQFKFCRFALFTSFLINEIINYGNNIKNIIDLKIKTKEFIDVIKQKLDLYKNRTNINVVVNKNK